MLINQTAYEYQVTPSLQIPLVSIPSKHGDRGLLIQMTNFYLRDLILNLSLLPVEPEPECILVYFAISIECSVSFMQYNMYHQYPIESHRHMLYGEYIYARSST